MKSQILKKFVFKDNKEDYFHSSGYAKSQAGTNMGASSTESFEKRQKIDLKRKLVRRYDDSRVVNDLGRERAKVGASTRGEMKKRKEGGGRFKREEGGSRFASKNEKPSRTLASSAGSAEAKRAMMPRKNPGIFR